MYLPLRSVFFLSLSLLLWVFSPGVGSAAAPTPTPPRGFELVRQENGVQFYKKDYAGGNPDYVQVINLRQGAQIVILHGEISTLREGHGVYGGNDPRILSQSLQSYWQQLSNSYDMPFCIFNGQFFYMKESPTRLPFPLKVDGEMISDGYGINQFPDQKLMFEIWDDHVRIRPLTQQALYSSSAPDIVVGLDEEARKSIDHYVGRTFIGIEDGDRDGQAEIVMIFNTLTARQEDAAEVLRQFGADQIMMLDGGGSTQLSCQGQAYIASERLIPQAVGVIAAPKGSSLAGIQSEASSQEANADASAESGIIQGSEDQLASQDSTGDAPGQASIDLSSIAWVPIILLPIGMLIFLLIKSRSAS